MVSEPEMWKFLLWRRTKVPCRCSVTNCCKYLDILNIYSICAKPSWVAGVCNQTNLEPSCLRLSQSHYIPRTYTVYWVVLHTLYCTSTGYPACLNTVATGRLRGGKCFEKDSWKCFKGLHNISYYTTTILGGDSSAAGSGRDKNLYCSSERNLSGWLFNSSLYVSIQYINVSG